MNKNIHHKHTYTLGLDLGISSVGWSVIELEKNKNKKLSPYRLLEAGVRIFPAAENPKNGESLNVSRREARSSRRRLRRRRFRLNKLIKLLKHYGFINNFSELSQTTISPWEVRSDAVNGFTKSKKLNNLELSIAIYHITKRRGFKSNRKHDNSGEGGVYKKSIESNSQLMKNDGYVTYGEMFFNNKTFSDKKRNASGSYKSMVLRQKLYDELELILNEQKKLGNKKITDEFQRNVFNIFSMQRPFASGDDIKNMVGHCDLEKNELRASKKSISFEKFRFWQTVNNLKIISTTNGYSERELSQEEKHKIYNTAINQKNIKYKKIRQLLNLADDIHFKGLAYPQASEIKIKNPETRDCSSFEGFYLLKKTIEKIDKNYWQKIATDIDLLDYIAEVLTLYKTDEDIREKLILKNIQTNIIDELIKITTFNQFSHLSLKAIKKILPFIIEGSDYINAIDKAGYNFKIISKKHFKLPSINSSKIKNPVVVRSLSQTRKVVNAIIDKYGSPTFMNIELARSVGLPRSVRNKIQKIQNLRHDKNQKILERLKTEFNLSNPRGGDILKYKLWEEQQEKCLLSLKRIEPDLLFAPNTTQIDHAIPFSRSFDDSYFNKILVLTNENQNKKDQTPYEYLDGESNSNRWRKYEAFVNSLHIYGKKKGKLLSTKIPESSRNALVTFAARDLNDVRYVSKYFSQHVRDNLQFAESNNKKKVRSINGRVTAILRRRWGLSKNRSENHRHHALDAVVVACLSDGMIQKISQAYKSEELIGKNKNLKFPKPWHNFREDITGRIFSDNLKSHLKDNDLEGLYEGVEEFIKPIFVSRAPKRKFKGSIHKAGVYSKKMLDKGIIFTSKNLLNISQKDIGNMIGNDKLLKKALLDRLNGFDGNAKKAFEKPLYKPSRNGKEGHIVKKIKIGENKSVTDSRKDNEGKTIGVSKNASMVRVDVFKKNNKFLLIPIYTADVSKKILPNKAIIANKSEAQWIKIDENFRFIFSLQYNDYLILTKKEIIKEGYYLGINRKDGSIKLSPHDKSGKSISIGAKTQDTIEKHIISPLGKKYKVNKEKRRGL